MHLISVIKAILIGPYNREKRPVILDGGPNAVNSKRCVEIQSVGTHNNYLRSALYSVFHHDPYKTVVHYKPATQTNGFFHSMNFNERFQ